ncbi:MAG: hypothetical protein ACO26G_07105 [Rickettsiales bacterium]
MLKNIFSTKNPSLKRSLYDFSFNIDLTNPKIEQKNDDKPKNIPKELTDEEIKIIAGLTDLHLPSPSLSDIKKDVKKLSDQQKDSKGR